MEQIFNQIIDNFNFPYMLSINLVTYFIIKLIDELNGDKSVSVLIKRIVLIVCTIICFIIYKYMNKIEIDILINSTIAAPVAWSWFIRPVFEKFNIGYKKTNNDKNVK